MKRIPALLISLSLFGFLSLLTGSLAQADQSHARIVRLSLVQGDVRFASEFHKDSLDDSKAHWEIAPLNLPIREGYAIATDANGRAEVEFESGAMAFLSANTLIEFYDLSLEDGARVTRLILRQGSAIFYVNPAKGDYFSVTGGDFSVEAAGRTRFRLDNYDDGSNVNVEQGQINVLRDKVSKMLQKGQSYSLNINNNNGPVIARATEDDEFDKWVSGRIDAVATATNYASQYMSSPDYTSGFADLYNNGSFYNIPGYGFGWQPYGVGLGWDPFMYGSWYSDPFFGFGFIGSSPWGWLPYHYGGWIFSPVYGWVWMPTPGFAYGGPVVYHPATAVVVRNGSTTGFVPMSPLDAHGKQPLNLAQGVYSFHGNVAPMASATGQKWNVVKAPPRETFSGSIFAQTSQPTRVSRTILSSSAGSRPVTISRDSSIVYDASQHSFVNNNNSVAKPQPDGTRNAGNANVPEKGTTGATASRSNEARVPTPAPSATATRSANAAPPYRPHISPPAPPSSGGNNGHSGGGTATVWNPPAPAPSSPSSGSSGSVGHSGGGHH